VFLCLLAWACVSDLRTRRIPNLVVVLLVLSGLLHSVAGADSLGSGLARAAAGFGVGFAIWLPFYLAGALGAGDVKLFAAAATWLGPAFAVRAALASAICGGVLALAWIVVADPTGLSRFVGLLPGAATRLRPQQPTPASKRARVPYGLAMAAGLATTAFFDLLPTAVRL
jgi:prepilin peptidase CpaA